MSLDNLWSPNSFYSTGSEILRKPSLSEAISNTIDLAVGRVKSGCVRRSGSLQSWHSMPHGFIPRNTETSLSITYDDVISRRLMPSLTNLEGSDRKRKSDETGAFLTYDIGSRTLVNHQVNRETDTAATCEQPSAKKSAFAPPSKHRIHLPVNHISRSHRRNHKPMEVGEFPVYDVGSRTLGGAYKFCSKVEVASDRQYSPETLTSHTAGSKSEVAASIEGPSEKSANNLLPQQSPKNTHLASKKPPYRGCKPNAIGTVFISAHKPKVENKENPISTKMPELTTPETFRDDPGMSSVVLEKVLPVISQPVTLKQTDELTSIPDFEKPLVCSKLRLADPQVTRVPPSVRASRKPSVGSSARGATSISRQAEHVEVLFVSLRKMSSNDSLGFGDTSEETVQESREDSEKSVNHEEMLQVLRQWRKKSIHKVLSRSSVLEEANRYFGGNNFSKKELREFLFTTRMELMDRLKVAAQDLKVIEEFLESITSNEDLDNEHRTKVFNSSVEKLNSGVCKLKLAPKPTDATGPR